MRQDRAGGGPEKGRSPRPGLLMLCALVLFVGAQGLAPTPAARPAAGPPVLHALTPRRPGWPITQALATEIPPHAPAHGAITYGTWGAGYVADAPAGKAFTAFRTRFVAPRAAQAPGGPASWVSIWGGVGLGAAPGTELMQAGISMQASGGVWRVAWPWWINEPRTPTEPHILYLTIRPGDVIEAEGRSIGGNRWWFRVADVTTGAAQTGECIQCRTHGATAAWVMEDPLSSSGGGQTGFANPGQLHFLSAAAAVGGGALIPLPRLDWHPLLRVDGTGRQGPRTKVGMTARGGFTLGRVG